MSLNESAFAQYLEQLSNSNDSLYSQGYSTWYRVPTSSVSTEDTLLLLLLKE